ncbi:MAG: ureidoglycolate lyase [Alphaproteobacteria bacterium]|nr:ureidoglycolate lyase [Alphaproteobacteria bacterium]
MSRTIKPEPLSQAAFAPYGSIIEADPAMAFEINDGFTTRFHALAEAQSDAQVILSIFRGRPRPLRVAMLERHPHGSQAFMPLSARPWLAVVASEPTPRACRLFMVNGGQGLQYRRGVWHHPLLVLDEAQDFLVVDRKGPGENLDEVFFPEPMSLSFTPNNWP